MSNRVMSGKTLTECGGRRGGGSEIKYRMVSLEKWKMVVVGSQEASGDLPSSARLF